MLWLWLWISIMSKWAISNVYFSQMIILHFLNQRKFWLKQQKTFWNTSTPIYCLIFSSDICSSMEKSTWQEILEEEGIRMSPGPRCSIGEGEDLLVLRYSTASWRIMFPCLSMQWKVPKKNRPSWIPTSIRWNSIFLTWLTTSEPSVSDPPELPIPIDDFSASCSI